VFGIDLNNAELWKQSGGLIILCVVLMAANVAQFRVILMLINKYFTLLGDYHKLGTELFTAIQQTSAESRSLKEGLKIYDMLSAISETICRDGDNVAEYSGARTNKR
jgi:hypothetical protein